jgi:ABC-type antimicrobial peptide transport system permease subunit
LEWSPRRETDSHFRDPCLDPISTSARSEARRGEVAVRRALGADERGIASFFLAESLVLAALGGAAGLGLALAAVQLLVASGPTMLPRLHEVRLDWIYGVMSFIVNQRTAEIGLRVALGARPGSVAAMIVRQGGIVAVTGAVIGLALAFGSGRFVESLLFRVSPQDPLVLTATTLLLVSIALLACWLPARRAARLDPVEALRTN